VRGLAERIWLSHGRLTMLIEERVASVEVPAVAAHTKEL